MTGTAQLGDLPVASSPTPEAPIGELPDTVRLRRIRAGRLWLLSATLAMTTAVLYVTVVRHIGPSSTQFDFYWWLLAALFCLSEVFVVHLHFRRDSHSISLSEFPLVLGLFFATPVGLLVGQMVGTALALVVRRRQRPLKLVFNLVQFALSTSLAVVVFNVITEGHEERGRVWLAAFIATCAASAVSTLAIATAVSLGEGRVDVQRWLKVLTFSVGVTVTNTSVALIGIIILRSDWRASLLLLLPAAVLLQAYKAYVLERHKHERIQFLYESSRLMQRSQEPQEASVSLLRHACTMFRCELAELILFARNERDGAVRISVGPADHVEVLAAVEPALARGLIKAMGKEPEPVLVPEVQDSPVGGYFKSRGMTSVMVAPLHAEARIIGMIVVANRLGEVSTFELEDLRLLETLASQASASLENARLEAELKHQAFHDSLTQLANRALFTDRVEHALARRSSEQKPLAVLFLDLDDFKTVNDSLGHIAGDQLLVAVAERLRACLRPEDTAARLGGDEFAILLEDVTDINDPIRVAERIVEALRSPFIVQGEDVINHASIGIATSRSPRTTADELLRQADEAMYMAKEQGKGRYEVFKPSMHTAVVERHELKGDLLKRDFQTQTFSIHYQPIVRLQNGEIVGVEALLRWQHPKRGLISPNDFIGIAEETGLILPLGKWVLQKAARQVHRWQEKYPEHGQLGVSVNLSARQLLQPSLIEDVLQALAASDLEPHDLMLEITESVMMHDMETSVAQLRQLKALGVRLAIDDFGTGYSSLSILQQVPADTLKIAKQFVEGIGQDTSKEDFASAIIKLGQTVHMDVVAEGIESSRQAERLSQLGCQFGQGFLFSQPLTPSKIDEQLSRALSFGTAFGRGADTPADGAEMIDIEKVYKKRGKAS